MGNYDEEINEIEALEKKLSDIFDNFEINHKAVGGYTTPDENSRLILRTALLTICGNEDEIERIEAEIEQRNNPKIQLSLDPNDLLLIILGLISLRQSKVAERFVKDSIAKGMTNEKRWSKVAEIMLIKNPNEKLSIHGTEELIYYSAQISKGLSPRLASEEVFRRFKFNTQEACDKWLRREIDKYKKDQPTHWFGGLRKPSTSPRTK